MLNINHCYTMYSVIVIVAVGVPPVMLADQ